MTRAMDWLAARQEVDFLTMEETDAVRDFTLLWSMFEDSAMGTRGSQQAVVAAVGRMTIPALLSRQFADALAFWRDRYSPADEKTASFEALNFALNEHRTATLHVLHGKTDDPVQVVTALLQISLRLRNNLFHGAKWQYGLQNQLDNFNHAGEVLMRAIELTPPAS